jgi:hydroxyacylglutathione hydrolase
VLRGVDQDPDEIVWQAAKIGYDNVLGELTGGIEGAVTAGLPTIATTTVASVDAGPAVIDVRQSSEFTAGHLPGAHNVELGSLSAATSSLPAVPVTVMCERGERAMTAASLLERAGRNDVTAVVGGPDDWASASGVALESGG